MKNKFFLFACLALFTLSSCEKGGDYIEFEDNALMKRCLLLEDYNQDGKLSVEEAANIEKLNVKGLGIQSLNGIENLPNLRSLVISNNPIKTLVLRNNTQLSGVVAENCPLQTIDLSGCTNLRSLYLSGASLGRLDLSPFPNLYQAELSSCGLKELELRNNPNLNSLLLRNDNLASVDLSANLELETLSLFGLPIKKLELSNNKNLKTLTIDQLQLDPVILSLPQLNRVSIYNSSADIDFSNCPNMESLKISKSNFKTLVLNKSLTHLMIDDSTLDLLDHTRCTALNNITLSNTPIQRLDLSNTEQGSNPMYSVSIDNCSLKELVFPKFKIHSLSVIIKNNLLTELTIHADPSYSLHSLRLINEKLLSKLYLTKNVTIFGITQNRSSQYIPDNTEIIYLDE